MDLGSFLADDSLGGSWADEEVDMSSIGVPINSTGGNRREDFSYQLSTFGGEPRRERKEFPIPDQPPYRVRVGNLPWDITEAILARFFENRMQLLDIIEEIKLPVDTTTGKLKGFGFVTFKERNHLEEALNLNLADISGRKVFVNVAAPQKQDVFDVDWRAARVGPLESKRREESNLDWGAARGASSGLPPRERSNRRPRTEEPDLDWGTARSSAGALPPRERSNRKPRREEPDLDWSSARHTSGALPPRERSNRRVKKDDPELDWGSARTSTTTLPSREKSNRRPRKDEKDFDWKRGHAVEPRAKTSKSNSKSDNTKNESIKLQKSSYDVLAVSDSEEEKEEKEVKEDKADNGNKKEQVNEIQKNNASEPSESDINKLQQDTSELSIGKDVEGWEVVGNK